MRKYSTCFLKSTSKNHLKVVNLIIFVSQILSIQDQFGKVYTFLKYPKPGRYK